MTHELTRQASQVVDWGKVFDAAAQDRGQLTASAEGHERAKKIFSTAKTEFSRAGQSLRRLTRFATGLIGVAVAMAIAGVLLAAMFEYIVAGATIATAGVAAMFVLFKRVYRLGRDQVLFDFFIAKYELAVALSPPEKIPELVDKFLEEARTLQSQGTS